MDSASNNSLLEICDILQKCGLLSEILPLEQVLLRVLERIFCDRHCLCFRCSKRSSECASEIGSTKLNCQRG